MHHGPRQHSVGEVLDLETLAALPHNGAPRSGDTRHARLLSSVPVGHRRSGVLWHPFNAEDRAHQWLRELLRSAAVHIAAEVPGFEAVKDARASEHPC